MPTMEPVSSSMIAAVGYDDEFEDLHVEFVKSGTYVYSGVPRAVYEDLLHASSIGNYVNQVLIPSYPYRRL